MRTTAVLAVAGAWLEAWDTGAQTINQGAVMQEAAPLERNGRSRQLRAWVIMK